MTPAFHISFAQSRDKYTESHELYISFILLMKRSLTFGHKKKFWSRFGPKKCLKVLWATLFFRNKEINAEEPHSNLDMFDISEQFMRVLFVLLFIYNLNALLVTCLEEHLSSCPCERCFCPQFCIVLLLFYHIIYYMTFLWPRKDSWSLPPSLGLIIDNAPHKNYKHKIKWVKPAIIAFDLLHAGDTKQICVWAAALPLNSCWADQIKPVCGHLFAELLDCQSLMLDELLN